jgi:TolB protein
MRVTSLLSTALARLVVVGAAIALALPTGAQGQDVEERFPGVSLGITYDGREAATLAIQPFTGVSGGEEIASQVQGIIGRDLRYSNRFQVLDSLPRGISRDEVDYGLWDQIGADFLVTGRVEGAGITSTLVVELHDIVYREVMDRARFPLPNPDSGDFRMAVHTAADEIVYWATGDPGIAATRVVYSQRMEDGNQELWVVDFDGENRRRITDHASISMSPAWSPDGNRVAYVSYRTGLPRIYELNLSTGEERSVPAPREGDYITPTYTPDGQSLIFAVVGGRRSGLFTYNIVRECCFANISEGPYEDISPTVSPDGSRIAFNSNRLGEGAPQIYLVPVGGGQANLLSPYTPGRPGYYSSPDWSPLGNRIAFHGRVDRGMPHQILISEVGTGTRSNRLVQVTSQGRNEDPSWAPDGRHLVYVGERNWGRGLFIVDAVTGNERTLVSGIRPNVPAWSPSLASGVTADR